MQWEHAATGGDNGGNCAIKKTEVPLKKQEREERAIERGIIATEPDPVKRVKRHNPCPKCTGAMKLEKVAGRWALVCGKCQYLTY
jgi:ribosomal protein S27AE